MTKFNGRFNDSDLGNKYILTIQDELTKFSEAFALPNKEANTVARVLVEEYFMRYGISKEVATDQGTEFMNSTMNSVCKLLKVKKLESTAYHHESIGALENSHKLLGSYLRSFMVDGYANWDTWIRYYVFCYNNAVHSSTGYTPHELVYGKSCLLPSNFRGRKTYIEPLYNYEDYAKELKYRLQKALSDARETLLKTKTQRKETFDKNTKQKPFKIGDKVMLKSENRKKLEPTFKGPYDIIDVGSNDVNCKIKIGNKIPVVHKNRLRVI